MRKVRVLLADDNQLFREGLESILNSQPDFEVVGVAGDGLEVLVKARKYLPDLILMDIGMPGCDGVEATRLVKQEAEQTMIVMLTVHSDDEKLFEAIQYGAQGYLLKSIVKQELLARLRGAVRGEVVIAPGLGGRMLEEFRRMRTIVPHSVDDEEIVLTPREQEVLSLAAQGATDQEIADTLMISINTVKSHMRNILAKLHVGHRREAAQLALREGLISDNTPDHLGEEDHLSGGESMT